MQQNIFPNSVDQLLPFDGEALYFSSFFSSEESLQFFNDLKESITWRQDPIIIFGKEVMQPRLTALYGDPTVPYGYSGIEMKTNPWNTTLSTIKNKVEKATGHIFTHVLLNYYRTGQDSMGWHRDNEPVLGTNPTIASVSFGEARTFQFRNYKRKEIKREVSLEDGSLLLMRGETQHCWEHQLPKRKRITGSRINLTFRKIFK